MKIMLKAANCKLLLLLLNYISKKPNLKFDISAIV